MLPGGPPTKKRKGGVQQRLAKAAQECQSALYALLMTHFAKGLMSGALIHSIAKAAQQDLENAASGLKITELKKIASLEHAKNLGPMLTRMMAKESTLPDPLQVHMPMKGSVDHTPSFYHTSTLQLCTKRMKPGKNASSQIQPNFLVFGIHLKATHVCSPIHVEEGRDGRASPYHWDYTVMRCQS